MVDSSSKSWLEKYPQSIAASLNYEKKHLFTYLAETASKFPDKKALYFFGKEISFSELLSYVLTFSEYLKELGIKKGDRVAIMLPNCPQAVISYYGILHAGGIVVPTNPMYKERELEYQLNDSGSLIIICLDILFPRVAKIFEKTSLKHLIITEIKNFLPFPKNFFYPYLQKKEYGIVVDVETNEHTHLFKNIIDNHLPHFSDPASIDPEKDLAVIQYTGGTTGDPKGVMLTHHNLVANARMCIEWLEKSKEGEERLLALVPFFHVYGMTVVMNLSIMFAAKMILLPKFKPKEVLKMIDKQKPTLFPGAPTIYIGLLNHPDIHKYDLSSIEGCISGSAPLPAEVQEQFEKVTGGRLVEGYGLTEASPCTHANFIWGEQRVKGSIGVPWPDTDAIILSHETGEPASANEIGEIAVKGPQVMKGYWNRPEETEAVMKDGWLLTGDLGYQDENGYFYIVDRKKDMIIASGFNVYPREIEEVLYEHPAIQEVVIVGVPDKYRGETVKAYVVLKKGKNCKSEELEQFCRKYLASYKVPRVFEFRNELPKTAIGKILRRVLIDEEKRNHNTK